MGEREDDRGLVAAGVEAVIAWVERNAAQLRNSDDSLAGYVITADEWRALRSSMRRTVRQ